MAQMQIAIKVISDIFNSEDTISVRGKGKIALFTPGINIQKQKHSSTYSEIPLSLKLAVRLCPMSLFPHRFSGPPCCCYRLQGILNTALDMLQWCDTQSTFRETWPPSSNFKMGAHALARAHTHTHTEVGHLQAYISFPSQEEGN